MSDDWAEDYDWDDELEVYAYEDELDSDLEESDEAEATGPCPGCGVDLLVDAELCAACGYWLTTADRHAMWDGGSVSKKMLGVGKIALVIFLVLVLSGLALL